MAYSTADKRRVYLACRAIFSGNNAQLRKPKKIREAVEVRKSSVNPLIRDFGTPKLVEILQDLLNSQVFQSDLRAKVAFPELFRSTPEQDVQRAESEHNAARSVAETLEEIASLEGREDELHTEGDERDEGDEIVLVPGAKTAGNTYI
jgi:hypothetical protein